MGLNDYDDIIQVAADENGLSPAFIKAVMKVESAGKPMAVSGEGAMGLMQLMPSTAKGLGVSKPFDPEQNIRGGAKLLRSLHDKYGGDTPTVLMAYHAGEGNVDNFLSGKKSGVGPLTKSYPGKVWNAFTSFVGPSEAQAADSPAPTVPSQGIEQPVVPSEALGLVPNQTETTPEVEAPKLHYDLSDVPGFETPKPSDENRPKTHFDLSDVPGFEDTQQKPPPTQIDLGAFDPKQYANTLAALKSGTWAQKHPDQAAMIEKMDPVERAMTGVGMGLTDAYRGGEQALAQLKESTGFPQTMPEDPNRLQRITQEGMQAREEFAPLARYSPLAQLGETVGRSAPAMAVPVPGASAANPAVRAIMSALGGAGLGAAGFVEPGQSRTGNALLGGAMGGTVPLAMTVVSKLVNAASGPPAVNPEQMLRRQLSEKWNIPLTTSEEATGQSSRMDVLLERMPGFTGTKAFRGNQWEKSADAAKRFFSEYVVDPTLGTTAAMKEVNDAYLATLYNKVRATGATVPLAPADNVEAATQVLLKRFPGVFQSIQDNNVKKILLNISGDVSDQTIQTGLVTQSGRPITRTVTPEFSFFDLWELRKGIGQEIRDAGTDTARGQFKAVYSAVSEDIDNMLAGSGGKALNDFKAANEAFKTYSVKFDVLREAYDKAVGTTKAGEFFSPKKFSTDLKNLANDPNYKKNVNWSQGEVEEMTGLANILQVAKRSGQFMENPPTGQRYGALTAGIEALAYLKYGTKGALSAAGSMGAIAGTSLVAKFLTTTEAGKRLSLAASKVEGATPAMNKIMNEIYAQMPKFAVEYGLMENQNRGIRAGNPLRPKDTE